MRRTIEAGPIVRRIRKPHRLAVSIIAWMGATSVSLADCPSDKAWLPKTPAPSFQKPPPHPAPDCGFYQPAWQNFLFVTQLGSDGRPAFLSFPTIADVFSPTVSSGFALPRVGMLSLAPRALKGSNDPSSDPPGKAAAVNAGARQAGLNGLLVDQRGNPIFYAIHMNQAYANFIRQNGLTTKSAVQNADGNLSFPKGAVELKSAWQIVPEGTPTDSFIATRALVQSLKQTGNSIVIDETAPSREVTVALLAIHVVFALEGHPEFIWATFEHISGDGKGDLAPPASALPGADNGLPGGTDGPVSSKDFVLYEPNTPASASNTFTDAALSAAFNQATQSFATGGAIFQTSIYRLYPASKLGATDEDDDVVSLNQHMVGDFASGNAADKRANYRLVGATWLDKPEATFVVNAKLANPSGVGPDDPGAVLVGEDGLSSMAMESFTQDSFVNCFSCHDTRPVKDLNGNLLVPAKKVNVSHILSKFVSEAK
jgi:hypothetical protein